MNKVIVGMFYGSFVAYEATFEKVMEIFKQRINNEFIYFPSEIKEIYENKDTNYLSKDYFIWSITNIFNSKDVGSKILSRLFYGRDTPCVFLSNDDLKELKLYFFDKKVVKESDINALLLNTSSCIESIINMPFMKPYKEKIGNSYSFVDENYLLAADTYRVILNNKWNKKLFDEQKISHILNFINTWLIDFRNEKPFELVTVND